MSARTAALVRPAATAAAIAGRATGTAACGRDAAAAAAGPAAGSGNAAAWASAAREEDREVEWGATATPTAAAGRAAAGRAAAARGDTAAAARGDTAAAAARGATAGTYKLTATAAECGRGRQRAAAVSPCGHFLHTRGSSWFSAAGSRAAAGSRVAAAEPTTAGGRIATAAGGRTARAAGGRTARAAGGRTATGAVAGRTAAAGGIAAGTEEEVATGRTATAGRGATAAGERTATGAVAGRAAAVAAGGRTAAAVDRTAATAAGGRTAAAAGGTRAAAAATGREVVDVVGARFCGRAGVSPSLVCSQGNSSLFSSFLRPPFSSLLPTPPRRPASFSFPYFLRPSLSVFSSFFSSFSSSSHCAASTAKLRHRQSLLFCWPPAAYPISLHEGLKVQAALCVDRMPLKFEEPAYERNWRNFREAWEERTLTQLLLHDALVSLKLGLPSGLRLPAAAGAAGGPSASSSSSALQQQPQQQKEKPQRGTAAAGAAAVGGIYRDFAGPSATAAIGRQGLEAAAAAAGDGSELEELLQQEGLLAAVDLLQRRRRKGKKDQEKRGEEVAGEKAISEGGAAAFSSRRAGEEEEKKEEEEDFHSLRRKPREMLFLIYRFGNDWCFPVADRIHGQSMRNTLRRLCKEQLGEGFSPYLLGYCPFTYQRQIFKQRQQEQQQRFSHRQQEDEEEQQQQQQQSFTHRREDEEEEEEEQEQKQRQQHFDEKTKHLQKQKRTSSKKQENAEKHKLLTPFGVRGNKIFFYRGRYIPGTANVVLPDDGPADDFAWATRTELQQLLSPQTWNVVAPGLPI